MSLFLLVSQQGILQPLTPNYPVNLYSLLVLEMLIRVLGSKLVKT